MAATGLFAKLPLILMIAAIISSQAWCQQGNDQDHLPDMIQPTVPDSMRTDVITGTFLQGENNRGFGLGYQKIYKKFILSLSAYVLDVGYASNTSRSQPVRPHTLNIGYDVNIGSRIAPWLGWYGGIGLFYPLYTYPGQKNVLQENESYSSSFNAGVQFYISRFIIGGGGTYYLANIYGEDFPDEDRDNFRNIWNTSLHLGWRF